MTPEQAAEEAAHLKGLFSLTTQERVDFWFDMFLRFPQSVVRWAVDECAIRYADKLDAPSLIALIQARMEPAEVRLAEAKRQAAARMESTRLLDRAAKESWDATEAVIASIPDQKLAEMKERALFGKPSLARYLGNKDPRKSRVLQSLIFEEIRR